MARATVRSRRRLPPAHCLKCRSVAASSCASAVSRGVSFGTRHSGIRQRRARICPDRVHPIRAKKAKRNIECNGYIEGAKATGWKQAINQLAVAYPTDSRTTCKPSPRTQTIGHSQLVLPIPLFSSCMLPCLRCFSHRYLRIKKMGNEPLLRRCPDARF